MKTANFLYFLVKNMIFNPLYCLNIEVFNI